MLLLPSIMTKNNFWTSELGLLTIDWKNRFPLTSPTRRIYCSPGNRPRSTSFVWRKDGGKEDADRAAFWESVGERVNSHCHQFYLLTCSHWKIKLMTYNYPTNCNILCFTEPWLNDYKDNIELEGFSMHRQNSAAKSGKTRGGGGGLFVNNSWCWCLILKKSRGIARLR